MSIAQAGLAFCSSPWVQIIAAAPPAEALLCQRLPFLVRTCEVSDSILGIEPAVLPNPHSLFHYLPKSFFVSSFLLPPFHYFVPSFYFYSFTLSLINSFLLSPLSKYIFVAYLFFPRSFSILSLLIPFFILFLLLLIQIKPTFGHMSVILSQMYKELTEIS